MDPALLARSGIADPMRAIVCLLMISLAGARAQAPAESAAYLKVRAARDLARRTGSERALEQFEWEARRFVTAYPDTERTATVRLWLGDLLKEAQPWEAHRQYLASGLAEARRRAADLAFRHEAPPPLRVDRWVGGSARVGQASGKVTLVVFFSLSHPQTRRLLPRLLELHRRFQARGLRVVAVAAVVDDHANQRPDQLEAGLRQFDLPFPAAVDEQRFGARSDSLRLYRGEVVPWTAVLDRYGRIASLGPFGLSRNALARVERTLQGLLDQPTFESYERRVRDGDLTALSQLKRIRTKETATRLVRLLRGELAPPVRRKALEILGELLPRGYLEDDLEAALERWPWEQQRFRYSFAKDRLERP
jgi:hypothetical protein